MNIAFLGLGAMGSRMARRLISAGHPVTVYNRSPVAAESLIAAGARYAGTPQSAVFAADVVFSMVTDDEAAAKIWLDPKDGAAAGLAPKTIAVECSTLSIVCIDLLGAALSAVGARFLDAPVVGSRPQAEAGKLQFLVGGAAADIEQIRPLLLNLGSAVHHVGPNGHGARLKLIVNAFFGTQAAALGELLALANLLGLDRDGAAALLASLPGTSAFAEGLLRAMRLRNHAPHAPIALIEKDLSYLIAAAEETGAPLPTTRVVHEQFAEAASRGFGPDNISGIIQLFDSPSRRDEMNRRGNETATLDAH